MTSKEAIEFLERLRAEMDQAIARPMKVQDGLAFVSKERLTRWRRELNDAIATLGGKRG